MSLALAGSRVPPRCAANANEGEGSVRLTLRGRTLIIFVAALVVLAVVSLGWVASSALATDESVGRPTTEWVVQPGESLWQIAERAAPGADPRETVSVIMELNDLGSASVQVGQSLRIPA